MDFDNSWIEKWGVVYGKETQFERVDISKEGIDENNYAYAFCNCPYPSNIVWRVPKDDEKCFKYYTCPECKQLMGVFANARKENVS